MIVLVVCEESQVITKAFREAGHEAYSCDVQECSGGHPEWHYQMDAFKAIDIVKPDLLIGHPPCDFISYAGTNVWNSPGRVYKRLEALKFFADLWEAPVKYICLENPKSCASPIIAKYSQEIQPYYFGDAHMKTTWLWLKNLPLLEYYLQADLFSAPTGCDKPKPISIDNTVRGKKRYFADAKLRSAKDRSKSFSGIAKAMAEQWGTVIVEQLKIAV